MSKCIGEGEVNISASIRAPYTKFLEVPEIHRNIFDHMGGVDTPMGRVLVPKLGQVEKIHGGMWRSISQLLLGPYTPNVLEVAETHRHI